MPMTNASMDAQTKPNAGPQGPDGGLADSTVEVQAPVTPGKAVKPADSNWSHCNTPNDYSNTQQG